MDIFNDNKTEIVNKIYIKYYITLYDTIIRYDSNISYHT